MRLFGKEQPAVPPSRLAGDSAVALVSIRIHWHSPTRFLFVSFILSIYFSHFSLFLSYILISFPLTSLPFFYFLSLSHRLHSNCPKTENETTNPWLSSFSFPSLFPISNHSLHLPSPFNPPSYFPSISSHSSSTPPAPPVSSSVAVVCVDGAAVRSGQKSRPGLLLLACPQWSVCACVCVSVSASVCVFVYVGVCSSLGESGHTGWPASSQPAVRVELGIWSFGIGPAGIFQRLLSPPLFNISLLLGVLTAESCLYCQHRPTVWYKLRWNIISVRCASCMLRTSRLYTKKQPPFQHGFTIGLNCFDRTLR